MAKHYGRSGSMKIKLRVPITTRCPEGRGSVRAWKNAGKRGSDGASPSRSLPNSSRSKLAELRRTIASGIEQVEHGELVSFDPHTTLERLRSRQASTARHE